MEELNSLAEVIDSEFVRFPYPTEMVDVIWDTLKDRNSVLKAATRL